MCYQALKVVPEDDDDMGDVNDSSDGMQVFSHLFMHEKISNA